MAHGPVTEQVGTHEKSGPTDPLCCSLTQLHFTVKVAGFTSNLGVRVPCYEVSEFSIMQFWINVPCSAVLGGKMKDQIVTRRLLLDILLRQLQ